jgi:IS5 family transposase
MRLKINIQPEFDFEPSNLKLTNQYYAKYEAMSKILDQNSQLVGLVHQDLKSALASTTAVDREGRKFQYTSDTVLRILICQTMEGESLRGITVRIDDSHYLRRFVRLYSGPMMDFTTLCKLKNAIGPQTWKRVNETLAKIAVRDGLISGERVRLDTTAVETNIHWPTDSSLLWDTYRVLGRLIDQVRPFDAPAVGPQRLQTRKVKKLQARVCRKATKNPNSAHQLQPLYERLLGLVEGILSWSASVAEALQAGIKARRYNWMDQALAEVIAADLVHYGTLGKRVVEQAKRRVLHGEQVPNDEKLFSIFEPHTELLKRGKAGKPVEFGHMIQIQQVKEKFITDYEVFEKKPVEHQLLEPALHRHRSLFGQNPDSLAADKAYYESMERVERLQAKVDLVAIAKKGQRTAEESQREQDPLFRHAQRFRAGVEGTISFLKRVLGLFRCFNKTWAHFVSTVGATIFAHNLLVLARC